MEEEKKILKFFSNILSEKIFLILFVFLIISLMIITSLNLFFSEKSIKEISYDKLSEKVNYQKKEIDLILNDTQSDISSIPNYNSVRGIVNSMRNGGASSETGLTFQYYINQLNLDFLSLMKLNKGYLKICYIDENGNEIIRLDYEDDEIKRVSEKDLENISSKIFFNEVMNFEKGRIYTSDIFLKKEKNSSVVEIPYTPMMKYAIPVFNKINKPVGIVSIDISANIFLKNLNKIFLEENEFEYEGGKNFLLSENGFYYHNPNEDKEWGNFDNLNTGENFKSDFPENIFSSISSKDSGIFESRGLELIFAYNTIFPNESNKEQFWVLLEIVPQNVILSPILDYRNYVFLSLLFLIFLSITFSFIIATIILKPIRSLNKELKIIKQGRLNYQILLKSKGEIGRLTEILNKVLIFFKESILNIEEKLKKEIKHREEEESVSEDEQVALLNVLEDVEEERDRVQEMAQNLIKFQLAVENVSDLIVITDVEGVIIYANKALEKMTGFKRKEVLGKKSGSKELWGGLMEKEFYQKMWRIIKEKKVFIGEFKNKRKNGEEYYAIVNIVPVLNKDNEISFFVAVERDVTEERAIDRAKSEFVSLASHQLRTPLSTIRWYSEMLIDGDAGKLKKEQIQYIKEIHKGNKRMIELVGALLNVSTLELGTFMVEPEDLDIRNISDKVIEEFGQKIKEKKQEFVKIYDSNISKIKLDMKLTSVIFENIISNAIKYTPEKGKIKLKILKEKDDIKIIISDTGIGIPKKQQGRIFEKLFRADNVKISDTDGTGLGLYIVKSILDQTGGKIWFKSKENEGSTFFITIPLKGMKSKKGIRKIT